MESVTSWANKIISETHIEEVDEEISSPAIMPDVGINQLEARHSAEGLLLWMFADLKK